MSDIFLLVNQLSVILAARRPQWVRQTEVLVGAGSSASAGATNGFPVASTSGVNLQNTTTALVAIDLREDPAFRTCKIAFNVIDLTGTYRTVIDGNGFSHVAAAADLNALIIGWRDAINASAPTNTIVTATGEDSTGLGGDFDTLVIRGIGSADYAMEISTPAGTGTLIGTYDASTAKAQMYYTAKSFSPTGDPVALWHAGAGSFFDLNTTNFIERFSVAGLERGYVHLTEVRGHPLDAAPGNQFIFAARVAFGPAVQETAP